MIRIYEIADYLQDIGQLVRTIGPRHKLNCKEITGINVDLEASEGQLSWISAKNLKFQPERLNSFRGSLLICAEPESAAIPEDCLILVCKEPKLAMIAVINRFFHDLALIKWASPDENPISPDAVLAPGVRLGWGVVLGPRVKVGKGVSIGPNTVIANCNIGNHVTIGANCSIGLPGFGYEKDETGAFHRFPHLGGVIIEDEVEIGSNLCIDRGSIGNTILCRGVKVDNLVHIAHNVVIGPNSVVIANSMIGGSAILGENVWVAPSVSVMNQISIGDGSVLGLGAVVLKSVRKSAVMVGNPARPLERKG